MSTFKSSFFKLPKYSRFNYKPIYYDKNKEEREVEKARRRASNKLKSSTNIDTAFEKENLNNGQFMRILSLVGIMLSATFLITGFLPFLHTIVFLMACLLMFLRSIKQAR